MAETGGAEHPEQRMSRRQERWAAAQSALVAGNSTSNSNSNSSGNASSGDNNRSSTASTAAPGARGASASGLNDSTAGAAAADGGGGATQKRRRSSSGGNKENAAASKASKKSKKKDDVAAAGGGGGEGEADGGKKKKKKKEQHGGGDGDATKADATAAAADDAASRLAHDLEEQMRMLSAEGMGHNLMRVDWAARMSDLALLHEVGDLNAALHPFVSQAVVEAVRRDAQAAQALHDDVRVMPAAQQVPQPLDVEEAARAHLPAAAEYPMPLAQRLLAGMGAVLDRLAQERPMGLSARQGEDGTEASDLPPAAELLRQGALYRSIIQDEFPCHGCAVAATDINGNGGGGGSIPATASATSLVLRGYRKSSVTRVHAEFVVDPVETKADDSILMDAGSARYVRRDEEILRQVVQDGAHTTSGAINMYSFSSGNSNRNTGDADDSSAGGLFASAAVGNNKTVISDGASAAGGSGGKRVITVNMGSLRVKEHPDCTREHALAHILLDAYTQYKRLSSNLLSGLKSRRHYELIVEQLQRSLVRQQRLNAVAAAAEHRRASAAGLGGAAAPPPVGSTRRRSSTHQRVSSAGEGGNSNTNAAASIEEQLLAEQLAIAKTKLSMALEMEEHTLTAMWTAWKELVELWRGDAAAGGGAIKSQVRMSFSLTRKNDAEQTLYREEPGFNILDFEPHCVVEEPSGIIVAAPPQQQQQVGARPATAGNNGNNNAAGLQIGADGAVSSMPITKITGNRMLALQLYVKSGEASGLKLVGQTAPKQLDSVFGASFNETFELHVAREPQQMLIKVVLLCAPNDELLVKARQDARGGGGVFGGGGAAAGAVSNIIDVASVSIPPSLTHAVHELAFSTGERFTGSHDGMPHEVGGAVVVSTTWRTGGGLTVEAIERMFLAGEADPLDPRNAPLAAALRRHYQLRAATAATALSQRQIISLLGGTGGSVRRRSTGAAGAMAMTTAMDELNAAVGQQEADSNPFGGDRNNAGKDPLHVDRVLQPQPELCDRRLQLLSLKWRIQSGQLPTPTVFEKHIARRAIPATSEAAHLLARDVQAECDAEQAEIDTAKSTSAAGASDPNEAGKAWLARIRDKKMASKPPAATDAERLGKVMTLPTPWTIGDVGKYFRNLLVPRSGFNPPRKDRAELEAELTNRDKVQEQYGASTITAHVMKASNLPMRGDGTPIRAFVELRFVDKAVCTQPQTGVAPSWFETLSVPFEPEDFEDDTLGFIDDDIVLSVYDEVRVALPTTMTTNPTSQVTHFRIERRFLGAVKVPFYTLYSAENAAIEAQFRVFQPRAALGYVLSPGAAMPTVNLFVSLWPPLRKKASPPPNMADVQTQIIHAPAVSPALREVCARALDWTVRAQAAIATAAALQPKAANREVFPFAPASSRNLQLMCRFLRADGINPPPGVVTWEAAVRFVALFPFMVDMVTAAEGDEWSTVPEFLAAGVGDYEEIAILLVLLLRRLLPETHVFMVTGMGDVYAQAVYVLLHINGDWRLIDPRTGDIFNTTDPMVGLSEVSMIISHNQIWANTQLSGTPYTMMWNLDDSSHWMPMLETREHRELLNNGAVESLQPPIVQWGPVAPDAETQRFEDDVSRSVKAALRQLRAAAAAAAAASSKHSAAARATSSASGSSRRAAAAAAAAASSSSALSGSGGGGEIFFHERVAAMLRDCLRCMEDERIINANVPHFTVQESLDHALQEFGLEYVSVGSPVNRSVRKTAESSLVSQLGPLLDAVRETAVHEVGAQGARFAVAVHVRAYPHGIFSVWAFVCALVQRP